MCPRWPGRVIRVTDNPANGSECVVSESTAKLRPVAGEREQAKLPPKILAEQQPSRAPVGKTAPFPRSRSEQICDLRTDGKPANDRGVSRLLVSVLKWRKQHQMAAHGGEVSAPVTGCGECCWWEGILLVAKRDVSVPLV